MKRLIVLAGALSFFSASAVAGGCAYGGHAAADTEALPAMAMVGETEAEFLARLQKQKEDAATAKEMLHACPKNLFVRAGVTSPMA